MALEDIRIVLVSPAHPGNIGAVARAMKTMSLTRLVLVRPREFPASEADRRAMGAIDLLENARVVDDLDEAVGDCRLVMGCSARPRTFRHLQLEAREGAAQLLDETATGEGAALVFGPERTGLSNQDLDRCSHQVLIPANPDFSSLNLASAVQLIGYEIFMAAREQGIASPTAERRVRRTERPSRQDEMEYFYGHLERALDARGYLDGDMREVTLMKFRRLFGRSRPNAGELKILHSMMRMIDPSGD